MFWAEQVGFEKVIATMQKLASTHGQRWRPAALLERLAASGKGWSDVEKPA
jgi:3-hydroxyacyl-CoA dehydrogenase